MSPFIKGEFNSNSHFRDTVLVSTRQPLFFDPGSLHDLLQGAAELR
jgi:hypothetical protein